MLADVFVIALDILAILRAALREEIAVRRKSHDRDVEKVRRPAHHATGRVGPYLHPLATFAQIVDRSGHDIRHPHPRTRGRRWVGHDVFEVGLVLQIIETGDALSRVFQGGMGGDVLDPLPGILNLSSIA